jgi:hypothetical protein
MSLTSKRASIIMAAFATLLLVAAPHAVRAAGVLQNPDMQNCRQNMYQAHMKWAQDKATGLNKIWSNVTPPTMNGSCLNNLMSMFNTIGTITDPFNIIWHLVLSAIQNFVNQICQQIMATISSAINLVKSALCIPIPSNTLNFNLGGGGSFGGSSSCSGVSLLGNVNTSQTGPALPAMWQWYNNLQPR